MLRFYILDTGYLKTDKNNVDVDTENVLLAANQLKYQGLMAGLKHEFQTISAVTRSS